MKHRICPICDAIVNNGVMVCHCNKHHGIKIILVLNDRGSLQCLCGHEIRGSGSESVDAMLEHWRQGGESHYMQVLLMQE